MSEPSRRHVLGGAAMASLIASGASAGPFTETPQPPFGPAPKPLDGAELPSFRFPLGETPTKAFDGGTAKEATVAEFPVSEKLAGVYMTLVPGGLRELHWHANAAELGYVISGDCRVTTIDPQGQSEAVDFGPGDVWYFPRGHGHSIQGLGPGDCVFILIFDNGYFSEFGTFSISDWLGHTPPEVLAKNFGVPASLDQVPLTHRYRLLAQRPAIFAGGTMRTASMNEFPISATMTSAILTIKPGGMRELHWHPNAAEWQFYVRGTASMTVFGSHGRARTDAFAPGDVGYVPQGYGHYIENTGTDEALTDELEVMLVLNNSTYESISITAWMAANTDLLLATNFKVPASVFANFPKNAVVMPE